MAYNAGYQETVLDLVAETKELEKKWGQQSEENRAKIKSMKSMSCKDGSYRGMGWNQNTYTWRKCPRCEEEDYRKTKRVMSSCRMSGDACGTNFCWCRNCGYLKWCSFDDK